MRDQTCFQDWETIVLKKQNIPNSKIKCDSSTDAMKQKDDDVQKPLKITNELKIAMQQARISNKLSQKQLASIMCCQPSIINQYESGKAVPNNSFISRLEQKLKTKLPRIKKNKS